MRLFVALDITAEVRERIAEFLNKLRAGYPNARWVRPENLHVTLKFIGEVSETRVAEFTAALSEIHSSSFAQLEFRGTGFFPNDKRPRVFWIGIACEPECRRTRRCRLTKDSAAFGIAREVARISSAPDAVRASTSARLSTRCVASVEEYATRSLGAFARIGCIFIKARRRPMERGTLGSRVLILRLEKLRDAGIAQPVVVARARRISARVDSIWISRCTPRGHAGHPQVLAAEISARRMLRARSARALALSLFFWMPQKDFLRCGSRLNLPITAQIWMSVAAVGAVLGHVYPLWLGGKGGRGVSTAAGAFVLICWPAVVAAVAIWVTVLFAWRYVSLASIAAAAALPLLTYLLYAREFAPPRAVSIGVTLASMLVVWRHRENLGRLATGTESKLSIRRERE